MCLNDVTGGSDYGIMGERSLVIPAEDFASFRACWDISTHVDDLLEADETITLTLISTDTFVTLDSGLLIFTIQDSVSVTHCNRFM